MSILEKVHILKPCPEASLETIKALVESYDPEHHEAPVVLGHPEHDAPAWGWVKELSESDGNLYAKLDVSSELEQLISDGKYKKRSVSFYNSNPPVFRHLGFLGANTPKVKGLEPISLDDGNASYTDINQNVMTENKDLKPVVLYALSEVLDGVKAQSFKTEPVLSDDGTITGVVSLGEVEHSYTLSKGKNGNWTVDTEVMNPKVIDLAEQVKKLESQIKEQQTASSVKPLYQTKLTPQIISLSDCIEIVSKDSTGKVLKLLQNLPDIVSVDLSEESDIAESGFSIDPNESAIDFAKKFSC